MADLTDIAIRARMVREDCEKDSYAVDRTPFTPKGIGSTFGSTLAMIAVLAECIAELAEAQA